MLRGDFAWLAAILLILPGAALAQAAAQPPPTSASASPSAGASTSTAQPTDASKPADGASGGGGLAPICSDRPTKSTGACTVDAGHFQYEADILSTSFLHVDATTTDVWLVVNPTFKYGLTSNLDIEANISPLEIVHTRDPSGAKSTDVGISDLNLRLKYEFLNSLGGKLQAAIVPYVKAPTARPGIGNGLVEGGAILPVSYQLTDTVSLSLGPEVDALKNNNGDGLHANTAQLVSASVAMAHNITLYGELWGDWNFDPSGTTRQYSADVAASYLIGKYLQFDGGLNFGLNRDTPAVQAYVGVSQKF